MDKRTLKALHVSIRKWIKIATWEGDNNGAHDCPLCQLFLLEMECDGCPIKEKTGYPACYNTPYHVFQDTAIEEDAISLDGSRTFACGPESTHQAEQMAMFLIDLLPENERARYYE